MGGTPQPIFDMSKAVPLTPQEHPLFDMSKAQPIVTMSAAPPRGWLERAGEAVANAEVPGTGVTLGEAGNRAKEFANIAGTTALTLGGGPEGGVAGVLAQGGRTAQEIAQGAKFAHSLDEAGEGVDLLSKVKSALPSAATVEQVTKIAKVIRNVGVSAGVARYLWHEFFE